MTEFRSRSDRAATVGRAMRSPETPESETRPYGRRAFLGLLAGGLSAFAWAGPVSRVVSPLTSSISQLTANLLPLGGWRIYTITGVMPDLDADQWRLRVDGLVERPVTFSLAQLQALPRAEQTSTFHCVTGWTIDHVHWSGIRFHDLLAEVKPLPQAHALRFVSAERPYEDSLTLAQALEPDAMLAFGMDHQPLTRPHGAPARVVIPEMYGYKGVKWLERIELVGKQPEGYWERLGYDQDAWVGHSNGRG
jgi:DMSO/TMAO reductase YedYZ molybdopterin-dependent catalytic subunit